MEHRWPSAGDAPHEGLLKPEKAGISRVWVKASLAFGLRRLHTNTDYIIDCRALVVSFLVLFFSSFHLHIWDGQRKLAEVEIG